MRNSERLRRFLVKEKNLATVGGSKGLLIPSAWRELLNMERLRMYLDLANKRIILEPIDPVEKEIEL